LELDEDEQCKKCQHNNYKRQRTDDDVEPPPKRCEIDDGIPSALIDDILDLEENPPAIEPRPSTSHAPPSKLCLFCGTELDPTSNRFLCEHCHKTGNLILILFN
jgi:hypothetical protein